MFASKEAVVISKILIVDDEKSIRVTLQAFLNRNGYETDVAENAQTAWKHLILNTYDVVVADIILPCISGLELLRMIKHFSPKVSVVLITGEPTMESFDEAVYEQAFDYHCKPFSREAFLDTISKATHGDKPGGPGETTALDKRTAEDALTSKYAIPVGGSFFCTFFKHGPLLKGDKDCCNAKSDKRQI